MTGNPPKRGLAQAPTVSSTVGWHKAGHRSPFPSLRRRAARSQRPSASPGLTPQAPARLPSLGSKFCKRWAHHWLRQSPHPPASVPQCAMKAVCGCIRRSDADCAAQKSSQAFVKQTHSLPFCLVCAASCFPRLRECFTLVDFQGLRADVGQVVLAPPWSHVVRVSKCLARPTPLRVDIPPQALEPVGMRPLASMPKNFMLGHVCCSS
jgi:hypothetical protein